MWNYYSKYGAKKTEIDGIKFDSKLEANRYMQLKFLEEVGKIKELRLQQEFELQPKFKDKEGKTIRAINYIADFTYYNDKGEFIVEDTKGFETKEFKLKQKNVALQISRY